MAQELDVEHPMGSSKDGYSCFSVRQRNTKNWRFLYPGHEALLLSALGHTAICCSKKNEFWERIGAAGLACAKDWNDRVPVEPGATDIPIGGDTMVAASFLECQSDSEFPYTQPERGYYSIKITLGMDNQPDGLEEVSEPFLKEKTTTGAKSKAYGCCDLESGLSKLCECNWSQLQE
jgi:hypothetical protein